MTKHNFPPKEVYLSPHCEKCMNEPGELEILWCSTPMGDMCHRCDRREIRYVLDKRYLRGNDK